MKQLLIIKIYRCPSFQFFKINVYAYLGFIQWEVKQMKALGAIKHPIYGCNEMVKWFKALNFLQNNRCCPRIESAKCSDFRLKLLLLFF